MDSSFIIKRACKENAPKLTRIAFDAKRSWNYPEEYIKIWGDELTISSRYILQNIVFRIISGKKIVGFYSLVYIPEDYYSGEVKVNKGWWMDHLFILPEHHHKGLGTALVNHAREQLSARGVSSCLVFVDPNASGFYNKCGAEYQYDSPSSIAGRNLPVYKLSIQ